MMNKVELKLNINEIFRCDDEFEMIMLQVFTAREDVYTINKLLQRKDLAKTEFMFLFKIIIGITREANELLREIYKKYTDNLMAFSNWEQINLQQKELERFNNDKDKQSFSYMVMFNLRNQAFHYKDTKNIKNILEKCAQIESMFIFDKETVFNTEYAFTLEVFYNYVESVWKDYHKTEEAADSVSEFIKLISEYSVLVANSLDTLVDGYFEKYTNFTDDAFEKHTLKRKQS